MNDWIISILILSVLIFLTSRASNLIEHWAGRSSSQPNMAFYVTLALGTGLTVLAVNAVVELSLAYMACVAGVSAGFSALLGQYLFGKPRSE